jgi:hypothetical protein
MQQVLNISFDFDGTLTKKTVQDFARYCIDQGLNVWIVTSRANKGVHESYNIELFKVAESLGIPQDRIIFTNGGLKKDYFRQFSDFIFHLDDDWIELHEIEIHTDVKAIPVFGNSDWEQECYNAIQYVSQS